MTFKLTLETGEGRLTFDTDKDQTLLATLQKAGLATRNPCRNGVCGLCKCRLTAGEITYHWKVPHGLWEKDKTAGYILPCIAYSESDVVISDISLMTEGH